jgi:hypothetical protein
MLGEELPVGSICGAIFAAAKPMIQFAKFTTEHKISVQKSKFTKEMSFVIGNGVLKQDENEESVHGINGFF